LVDYKKIILELTLREASLICKCISSSLPAKEDEMISVMLYSRIKNMIETIGKNESL